MTNQKVYSVLLCALLSAGFAHEHTPRTTDSTSSTETSKDVSLLPNCEVVCKSSQSSRSLEIAANVASSLYGVANETAGVAIIIDLKENLVLLGSRNPIDILINLKNKSAVILNHKDPKIVRETLRQYLPSLKNGLRPLYELENASEFNLSSPPWNVIKVVNQIMNGLIAGIEEELKVNQKEGLQLAIAISSRLLTLQKGPLKGILRLLGLKGISINGDLIRILSVESRLGQFFGRFPGGIPALRRAGVNIDLQEIGEADQGLQVLAILLRQTGTKVNVGKYVGDLLNEVESLLKFIAGSTYTGVSGIFRVTSIIAHFIKADATLEQVINGIIEFLVANKNGNGDAISKQLSREIADTLKAVEQADCYESLSGLVKILKSLRKGTLKIDGVNVSEIISELISGAGNSNKLEVLVTVLLQLQKVVSIEDALPRTLLVLILNANNVLGIELLKECGVSIDIHLGTVRGSIIEYIVRSVPHLADRLALNVYDALCSVPIIGSIINPLDQAISACNIHKNMHQLLRASEEVGELIKAVFQIIGGLELKVPDDVCSRVEETVNRCSSLNFYLGLDVKATIVP